MRSLVFVHSFTAHAKITKRMQCRVPMRCLVLLMLSPASAGDQQPPSSPPPSFVTWWKGGSGGGADAAHWSGDTSAAAQLDVCGHGSYAHVSISESAFSTAAFQRICTNTLMTVDEDAYVCFGEGC